MVFDFFRIDYIPTNVNISSFNMENYIRIKGARVNNLKNVSIDIPRNKFVVVTGLS